MKMPTADDFRDGETHRRKSVVELFKLPESAAVSFVPSTDLVRIEGGRKKKHYTPKEQRRRLARKTRREHSSGRIAA